MRRRLRVRVWRRRVWESPTLQEIGGRPNRWKDGFVCEVEEQKTNEVSW